MITKATHPMTLINNIGDIAMQNATGPSHLQITLLDTLYLLNGE